MSGDIPAGQFGISAVAGEPIVFTFPEGQEFTCPMCEADVLGGRRSLEAEEAPVDHDEFTVAYATLYCPECGEPWELGF